MKSAAWVFPFFVSLCCAQAATNEGLPAEQSISARVQNLVARQIESAVQKSEIPVRPYSPAAMRPARALCGGSSIVLLCGGGAPIPERSKALLPRDPTPLLAESYLRCRTIRASIIEPAVPVSDYPEGSFGDQVYEGELITARAILSDEILLRQLFTLLVEALAFDESEDFLWREDGAMDALSFKNRARFKPNLLIEFIGPKNLRVELDFAADQALVRHDSKWGSYSLDKWSAAAIRTLIQQERSKKREIPIISQSHRP